MDQRENGTINIQATSVQRLTSGGSIISSPITIHYEIQDHASRMQRLTKAFKVYRLAVLTLICVLVSITLGLLCRPFAKNWTERQFMYIEFPGELYIRLLKLIIIPLLVSNVILSFGTMKKKLSSHLCKVALLLYFCSNLLAISLAIGFAIIINPGNRLTKSPLADDFNSKSGAPKHHDVIFFPSEFLSSILSQTREDHGTRNKANSDDSNGNGEPELSLKLDLIQGSTSDQDEDETKRMSPRINIQLDSTNYFFNEYHNPLRKYREYHPMLYHMEEPQDAAVGVAALEPNSWPPFGTDELARDPIGEHSGKRTVKPMPRRPPSPTRPTLQNLTVGRQHDHRFGLATKLPIDVLLDMFRNLVPDSLIGAALYQTRTRLFAPRGLQISPNGTLNPHPSLWPMGHEVLEQANIIGLLAVSVLSGLVLSHMDAAGKPILELCACVSEISLRIGIMAIQLTPLCIMFLIIGQVARTRDLSSVAGELFMYSITVISVLLLHGFLLMPLIYYFVSRRSPVSFFFSMHEALVASFATSSSSASMAMVLKCLNGMKLNPVVVGAFGPLGAVFNMNGTAIYEAIGAIFIAQTLNVSLPLTSLLLVGLSSAVASFSTSGIPSSGMMTMVIVLNSISLPVLPLSLIFIVDFVVDRFRTVVNVWTGSLVCALIDHVSPEHLFAAESQAKNGDKPPAGDDLEVQQVKPRIISVTITPPLESSDM